MKRQWKKQIRIIGLAALLSLSLGACAAKEAQGQKDGAGETGEPAQENPAGDQAPEPEALPEENQGKKLEGTESGREPESEQGASESLTGDIKEVGEGTFTIVKAQEEEEEDGGTILAVPVGEDVTEDTDVITVAYDDHTSFEKQTIWDGGARHEETEGSALDLEKGRMAVMSGYYEGQVFHAVSVQIVEVVL